MASAAATTLARRNVISARDRLIVALDVPTTEEASHLVEQLGDQVSFYKIGPHLQLARGLYEFARGLLGKDKGLFLDFKSVDIGDTITNAVRSAEALGAYFITVYGNRSAIQAAKKARIGEFPKILVITLLTDHNEADMQEEFHTDETVEQFVVRRSKAVADAGGDGVICSPKEVEIIRSIMASNFLIVTPGIRPDWWPGNGHKRYGPPRQAVNLGADYLVVGRPIVRDPNPAVAARRIIEEMESAFRERPAV